jgi:hypothetical protein
MLDEIACSLPAEFYGDLNGGVNLQPYAKLHPESGGNYDTLYIMGEYINDPRGLGRYINIYYGSFIEVYGYWDYGRQREELRKILVHEFTHHLESLGGEYDLEWKDAADMERYRRRRRGKLKPRRTE